MSMVMFFSLSIDLLAVLLLLLSVLVMCGADCGGGMMVNRNSYRSTLLNMNMHIKFMVMNVLLIVPSRVYCFALLF
ncbi:hypothetical protein ASPBRDRAFT_44039 [Aspergillus brasiliensis CBS 101740]|uniref:Secreted peptide n=1 Tax=Aspergillus brasiliensis (strain CBS 101740 / IMI 381727 / IBT 21946) TaxID=767769 RepID=A0A1L9UHL4_ASPBC|nr:hypothetical protein ASPBRDRAFT_44039 [Aspergillus brasiliensis CBS 101740]